MELKIDDTLRKIDKVIHTYKPYLSDEEMISSSDMLNSMDIKRSIFDRFADIVDGNEQREFLYQILRTMELFFDVNVKKNMLWGEVPPFPTDLVSDESPLVKDLYKVLYKHKKQKIQATNEEIKEMKELGLLEHSSEEDDWC